MNKYIDADKLIAEIERRIKCTELHRGDDVADASRQTLYWMKDFITSLQQEAQEEEKERKKRYDESFMAYWNSVIDTIDNKRVLPTFKGQLLHDFKNELHTMKQIVGLINHPEIHEGLFDKLALVFAAWGGYHFHPKESLPEDSLQQEQPETSNNLVDVDAVREDFIAEVYRVLDADSTNDRANAIIDAFDSLPTVSQEQPETPSGEEVMTMCNQILIDWVKEGKTPEEREQREQAHIQFFELYDEYMLEQPEMDLEKSRNLIRATLNGVTRLGSLCDDQTIEHAVDNLIDELGLNAKREEVNEIRG